MPPLLSWFLSFSLSSLLIFGVFLLPSKNRLLAAFEDRFVICLCVVAFFVLFSSSPFGEYRRIRSVCVEMHSRVTSSLSN